jgi:hypothetical protein
MSFWQILAIVYLVLMVICGLVLDGHPRSGKYSFFDMLCTAVVYAIVLYGGGFWG